MTERLCKSRGIGGERLALTGQPAPSTKNLGQTIALVIRLPFRPALRRGHRRVDQDQGTHHPIFERGELGCHRRSETLSKEVNLSQAQPIDQIGDGFGKGNDVRRSRGGVGFAVPRQIDRVNRSVRSHGGNQSSK